MNKPYFDFNPVSIAADKMNGATRSFANNIDRLLFFCGFLLLVCSSIPAAAAPHRSKSKSKEGPPQTVYDQKQTGDYNIQLHLKDFQIIALLGDDALGDYDYNYDYADFTVKPSSTSSTSKPSTTTQRPTSTTKAASSDSKPITSEEPNKPIPIPVLDSSSPKPASAIVTNLHPYPIEVVVLEPTKRPINIETSTTTEKQAEITSNKDSSLNEILNTTVSPESLFSITTTPTPYQSNTHATADTMTPGKIKVQILESPDPTIAEAPIAIGIVPGEDVQSDGTSGVLQGELANYRKCANGFSRDKKGRCRRVRKPGPGTHHLPFGFGRIASNLATRLRLPGYQDSSATAIMSSTTES